MPGLDLATRLARSGRYLMVTANNESLDLNLYRIETFGLRDRFALFFSSCFLGLKKPSPEFFRLILRVLQRAPERCLYVDDRPHNVEAAGDVGLPALHYTGPEALPGELERRGAEVPGAREPGGDPGSVSDE